MEFSQNGELQHNYKQSLVGKGVPYNEVFYELERKFITMNDRELAKSLIDKIPESRLFYVLSYLQGAAVPDETPNADTLEAFAELENDGGHKFTSTTEQLFAELMED